jgi:hypothetical protein
MVGYRMGWHYHLGFLKIRGFLTRLIAQFFRFYEERENIFYQTKVNIFVKLDNFNFEEGVTFMG